MEQTVTKNTKKIYAGIIIGIFALLLVDIITKQLAVAFLKDTPGITLIENVLRLQYLENRGAAFGIMQDKQIFFWILTAAFMFAAAWVCVKTPKTRHYRPVIICLMFLFTGALGNFIDRVVNHYVVDFIYFEIIDFPIFNVADIYVSLSVVALVILILFHYKDGDFSFLSFKKQKRKEQ